MANLSVLIVEDDPMVLDINKNFLSKVPGFVYAGEASTGKEAYEKIIQLKPDLILLDMFLPDMSGMDLFLRLRKERIPSDIIMITAARDAPTVQEAVRLGAFDYLIKPFRFERFERALHDYLRLIKRQPTNGMYAQQEIDSIFGHKEDETTLPKGLNDMTMKQILEGLVEIGAPVTSEQLAQNVGMARVTVRKYLDFLATTGKVTIDLKYGTVGRPTKYYSLK
ncbi:MAG: response regulator [Lysinibacillus sp.]